MVVPALVVVVFLSVAAVLLEVVALTVATGLFFTGVFVVAGAGFPVVCLALEVGLVDRRPAFLVLALVPLALVVDGFLVVVTFFTPGLAF